MDWIRLGLSLRALRIRRHWRQIDVATRAGASRSLISSIERGHAGDVTLATLIRIAAVLDARVDVALRWHGEQLHRLLDAAHAGLVERVVELLDSRGWTVAVEVSFAIRGERWSIDVLAMHRAMGRILVVEVKSVVPDSQATLHGLDRKVRLAPAIVADRGWAANGIGRLLVIGDGSTARRRIAALGATYGVALADRGSTVRRWLRRPVGPLSGLLSLPYATRDGPRSTTTGVTRVRPRGGSSAGRRNTSTARPADLWEDASPGHGADGR